MSDSESGGGGGVPVPASVETKGWLYKWTNYIKGYQKRWFVLSNGLLSYYRSQAEMAHTCRGTISLHGAIIHTEADSCNFIVSNGGGTQTFHLRAVNEVERQRWVTALELAKAKAIKMMEIDDGDEDDEEDVGSEEDEQANQEIDKRELINVVKTLSAKLQDLQTCHDLIVKHGQALQRSLTDLEVNGGEDKVKNVNERATLFKITSNAMINASSDFLELCSSHGRKWQRLLTTEREIRQRLEDMVEQLAKQHSHLETLVRKEIKEHPNDHQHEGDGANTACSAASAAQSGCPVATNASSPGTTSGCSDDEDEFQDAIDVHEIDFTVPVPPGLQNRRNDSPVDGDGDDDDNFYHEDDDDDDDDDEDKDKGRKQYNVIQRRSRLDLTDDGGDTEKKRLSSSSSSSSNKSSLVTVKRRKRRTSIPEKPNISFSLWSIMKNCIGKDLTKIPVPVNFAEPLSMLQRLVEDFEYSEILDRAAHAADDYEQLVHLAAFTVSAYSTTAIRTGKPFNPLLGETYECDRSDDKGFKSISEQVSHHPPMVAQYCESTNGTWRYWQEFTMRSKFKGKYLEVEPLGIAHCEFNKSGNHYTWRKVKTLVHNFVIGKLWIDQQGEMEIINHRTGDKCHMKFEPYSYFGGTPKKVTGTITSGTTGKVVWVVNGTWDAKLEGSKVLGETTVKGKSSLEIGPPKLLWTVNPLKPGAERYYNFSQFACELNEMEEGVAPTDCRLRPDQRLMENGEWDLANQEKIRLEEKQRAVRKQRELEAELAAHEGRPYEGYKSVWFKKDKDPQNGEKPIHVYKGGYWECKAKQDWSICPDIF